MQSKLHTPADRCCAVHAACRCLLLRQLLAVCAVMLERLHCRPRAKVAKQHHI